MEKCDHNCDILTADLSPEAKHFLDCPVWGLWGYLGVKQS